MSGLLVAGGAGGFGSADTDPRSDVVRRRDGSCAGWHPAGRGHWTAGLQAGAGFAVLDPVTDAVLGAGQLGRGTWDDLSDREGHQQWQCEFPFSVEMSPSTPLPMIQIAELMPAHTVTNPTGSGLVASVDLPLNGSDIPTECGRVTAAPTRTTRWTAVRRFWWTGLASICEAGITVASIRHRCRPSTVASDHIIEVVDADHPEAVYEDVYQQSADPTASSDSAVEVVVATGIPCA